MSDLSEFRYFCTLVRDLLRYVSDEWGKSGGVVSSSCDLPFPSHLDGCVVQLNKRWNERKAEELTELRVIHSLSRAICAVLKHDLRGVNVACVLSPNSTLKGIKKTQKKQVQKSIKQLFLER